VDAQNSSNTSSSSSSGSVGNTGTHISVLLTRTQPIDSTDLHDVCRSCTLLFHVQATNGHQRFSRAPPSGPLLLPREVARAAFICFFRAWLILLSHTPPCRCTGHTGVGSCGASFVRYVGFSLCADPPPLSGTLALSVTSLQLSSKPVPAVDWAASILASPSHQSNIPAQHPFLSRRTAHLRLALVNGTGSFLAVAESQSLSLSPSDPFAAQTTQWHLKAADSDGSNRPVIQLPYKNVAVRTFVGIRLVVELVDDDVVYGSTLFAIGEVDLETVFAKVRMPVCVCVCVRVCIWVHGFLFVCTAVCLSLRFSIHRVRHSFIPCSHRPIQM
jgi:hypothetical protein